MIARLSAIKVILELELSIQLLQLGNYFSPKRETTYYPHLISRVQIL